MGAYLSKPITSKNSEDGQANCLKYGASSMQGWRVSQEDAHNCVGSFDKDVSLFGVYDGHGGAEVAIYLSRHLPEFLKKNVDYIDGGDMKKALHTTYLSIDESLKTAEGLAEIQAIAKRKNDPQDEASGVDFEEENVCALYEEATMPLEALVAKYNAEKGVEIPETPAEERPCSSRSILSPKLPRKKPEVLAEEEPKSTPDEAGNSGNNGSSANGNSDGNGEIKNDNDEIKEKSEKPAGKAVIPDVEGKDCLNEQINVEHKNGETETESHKNEINLKKNSEVEASAKIIDEVEAKQHVNGEGNSKAETSTDAEPGGSGAGPGPVSAAPAELGRSARSAIGLLKRHIYQSLMVNETGSDSDLSDSEEDDSFHVPKIDVGDSSDEDDDGEVLNSGSSDEDEDDDEIDEEEESDEAEEEDDDFLNDSQEPGFDSGSTAVVALVKWEADKLHLWVANAGDSRCVISRNGRAFDMSKDHKPEEETEARRIVQAGGKVTIDGRVNGGLNLSRALGDHSYKQNKDLAAEEQMITPVPDVEHLELDPQIDDFIVLACDGIWNSMTSQQVVDFVSSRLSTETKLSEICEQLFDTCLARDTAGDGTGCDNMTAVIICLEKPKTAKRELRSDSVEDVAEEETKRAKLDAEEEESKTSA